MPGNRGRKDNPGLKKRDPASEKQNSTNTLVAQRLRLPDRRAQICTSGPGSSRVVLGEPDIASQLQQ